jgi:hypothetical protein
MAQHLYRFYLYIVFIALLIYTAVAIGLLLNTLLLLTSLRQTYETAPSAAGVLQSITFTLVSLLIAGALAGLHYWLIRRDIRTNKEAGNSAIRALLLNLTEAVGIAIAVPVFGYGFLYPLSTSSSEGLASAIAMTLPTLLLVGLLELERRRTQVVDGIALMFQRLHFYVMQLFFLAFFAGTFLYSLTLLLDGLFFTESGQIAKEICGPDTGNCSNYHPLFLTLNLLWFLAFWVLYGWATRNDKSAILRLIVQYVSVASGFGLLLYAIFQIGQILFLDVFHLAPAIRDIFGPYASNNFLAPLLLSIIVIAISDYWLHRATQVGLIKPKGLLFIEYAFLAILAGVVFWWGCGNSLYHLMESLFSGVAFDGRAWAIALAQIIAGIGYIPLDFFLWRRNNQGVEGASSPRRGLVLALLGGGILSFAIGAAVALYAWITALFGSPIANWQQTAHAGLAAFLVGAILVAIYLQAARREHLFVATAKQTQEPPPAWVPEQPVTIEQILDELLAGKITRDEAVTRIHGIAAEPAQDKEPVVAEPVQEIEKSIHGQ